MHSRRMQPTNSRHEVFTTKYLMGKVARKHVHAGNIHGWFLTIKRRNSGLPSDKPRKQALAGAFEEWDYCNPYTFLFLRTEALERKFPPSKDLIRGLVV